MNKPKPKPKQEPPPKEEEKKRDDKATEGDKGEEKRDQETAEASAGAEPAQAEQSATEEGKNLDEDMDIDWKSRPTRGNKRKKKEIRFKATSLDSNLFGLNRLNTLL